MPQDACLPRRDATALKPPRFPILTFDEWQLSLAPGSVFDLKWLMPGESLVSILWKFACANALPGHVLIHLLSPDIDPSEGLAPVGDDIDLTRLCRIVRLPQNVLRVSLLDAALPVGITRLSGIADYARPTATTACCISLRMSIVVRRINNCSKRVVRSVAAKRPTSSTPA
jgi:hypothetical protein